jgi:transcriptional regulator with XRE-family HTH domain
MTKNPAQIEVAEIFGRLEKKYGMTKADVGRELLIERGYVGYLVTGKRNPSARTLEQFRELERRSENPRGYVPAAGPVAVDLDHTVRALTLMRRNNKPNFDIVRKIIQSLSGESNSVVKQKSARFLKKASASAR